PVNRPIPFRGSRAGEQCDRLSVVRAASARGGTRDGRHVLGRKTVEYMLTDQLPAGADTSRLEKPGWNPDHGFGLAVAVRRRLGGLAGPGSVGEVTWPGAAGTYWWADPREDLGAVFMTHTPSRIQQRYHQIVRAL